MDSPGYIILSRLGAQLRATQVLANNLANTDTPGFRAERPIFAQYLLIQIFSFICVHTQAFIV